MSQNSDIEAKRKELRLEPEQLNSLILAAAESCANASLDENLDYLNVPVKNKKPLFLRYIDKLPISQKCSRQCVIFNVTKDSQDSRKEPQLVHIGNAIKAYLSIKPVRDDDENRILLLPMRQCRGFVKLPMFICNFFARYFNWHLQREHIVLVAVDLKMKTIVTHDSQSKLRGKLYPDRVKDVARAMENNDSSVGYGGYKYKYQAYETQKDDNLCGYFVYNYCKNYLENDGLNCATTMVTYDDVGESSKKYMQDRNAELPGEEKPEYQGLELEEGEEDGWGEVNNNRAKPNR